MKKIIFIAASLFALAACNKEVINTPVEAGKGVLNINVQSDDSVEINTKVAVSTDNFTVAVKSGNSVIQSGKPNEMSVVLLPAGNYSVYAENITSEEALSGNDGKGALHIAGASDEFTLDAGGTYTATVACVPVNAKITIAYEASFLNAFSSYTVTYDQIGGDRDFSGVQPSTDYFYNISSEASQNKVDVKLSATAKHDSSEKTHTQPITLEAKKHYAIKYSAGANGQVNVSITADDALTQTDTPVEVNPYK